jgi:DNA-binding transcriptional ArsR family regulator
VKELDYAADLAQGTLPPRLQELLLHPVRRRLLRALHTQRLPSTVRELTSREGLVDETSGQLSYHAGELGRAGLLTIVEELPVYRSELARDAEVLAFLAATHEGDRRAAGEV